MPVSFGWDVGDGRRSDSEGGKQGPEEVAKRASQNPTEAQRDCVTSKPERARAEQSEQHGRRGARRRAGVGSGAFPVMPEYR